MIGIPGQLTHWNPTPSIPVGAGRVSQTVTMRFRRKSLVDMQERITQLGMNACRICGSGHLLIHKRPGIVTFGGVHHERDDPRWDPESNILFMVMTCCDLCGNTQFFDSERLAPDSERSLVVGMTEEEEIAAEGDQGA